MKKISETSIAMLDLLMDEGEVTTQDFAELTGLSRSDCATRAKILERSGYIKVIRTAPNLQGGKPINVYGWTGLKPPSWCRPSDDSAWSRADNTLIKCINAMVLCGAELEAA
jgi:DNA-binding Lrp family transcriptional regulator